MVRISLGAARVSRGARDLLARTTRLVRIGLAWRWSGPLLRCALAGLGLVVLAAIGRSALAGGAAAPPATPATPLSVGTSALPIAVVAPASVASASPAAAATDGALRDAGVVSSTSARRATADDPVFLNQAAFEDLRRLPGVGPKRAQAILTLRQRLGRFRQIEDLLKVKGIGRSTLKKLRPLVRVDL